MADPALIPWLDAAWDDHADHPQRVLAQLEQAAPELPDHAEGARAVRLAEHLWLAHLHDTAGLHRFLERLPAREALRPAVQAALWAIDMIDARPAPMLPDALRWRSLHNVASALIALGRTAEARELLMDDEAAATASEDPAARRAYAASANNVAQDLRLGPRGDTARDTLMIDAAQLARRAWERAGTWLHIERAEYELARCHAALGHGLQALAHAHACLRGCEAGQADAMEHFFAHEALAHAHRACGDAGSAEDEVERMRALMQEISDPGLRALAQKSLGSLGSLEASA